MKKIIVVLCVILLSGCLNTSVKKFESKINDDLWVGDRAENVIKKLGKPQKIVLSDNFSQDYKSVALMYCQTGLYDRMLYVWVLNGEVKQFTTETNKLNGQCGDFFKGVDFDSTEKSGYLILSDYIKKPEIRNTPTTAQAINNAAARFNQSMQNSYQNDNTQEIIRNWSQGMREITDEMKRSDKIRCRKTFGLYDYECKQGGIFD